MSRQDSNIFHRSHRRTLIRRIVQLAALGLWLWLFLIVAWPIPAATQNPAPFAAEGYALSPQLFLWLDPLLGLSSAIAARTWNPALWGLAAIALLSIVFPRGFCSTICPLGTLIDGCDRLLGRHTRRRHIRYTGRIASLRFILLAIVLVAALGGVMLAGHIAALSLLTRGAQFSLGHWQIALVHGWSRTHPMNAMAIVAVGLLLGVLLLSLLGRRLWCRCLCPSGALLSLLGRLSPLRRRTTDSCVSCGKCRQVCDFDAIAEDFSTRADRCTFCQSCAEVCPTAAIKYGRRRSAALAPAGRPVAEAGNDLSRRAFITAAAGGAAITLLMRPALAGLGPRGPQLLLRPPGSRAEQEFRSLCIRCGQCMRVCPGQRLKAAGLEAGADALWTPVAVPIVNGCHPQCNRCTQACPTGAIRALTMEEKSRAVVGLAHINHKTCLPHTGQRECRLCFDECNAAGYRAIFMVRLELDVDLDAIPPGMMSEEEIEAMRYIEVPSVDATACVGCGLCEYRCHAANCRQQNLLDASAIQVSPTSAPPLRRRPSAP